MASIKISELESVTELTESDALPIINGNETKQVTITKLGDILATKGYVAEAIAELSSLGFTPIIVETLPTENISTNTIYLMLNTSQGEGNTYDEYVYINDNWELIGSTAVDLSNYYTKEEIDKLLSGESGSIDNTTYERLPLIKLSSVNPSTEDDYAAFSELFTNVYQRDGAFNKLAFYTQSESTTSALWTYAGVSLTGSGESQYISAVWLQRFIMNPVLKYSGFHKINYPITHNDDGTITVSRGSITVNQTFDSQFLAKDNTTSFTPSSSYNPATKKYVDDAISAAITTVLEAEY